MNNNDLRILLRAELDTGAKTIETLNKSIRELQAKVDALKLNIQIDDNVTKTLNNFSHQMSRLNKEAIEASKTMQQVTLPDGTKIKTTGFDSLHKSLDEIVISGQKAKKTAEGIVGETEKINQGMTKNLKLNRENIIETEKGLKNLKQQYSDERNIHNVLVEKDKTGKILSARYTTDHQKAKKIAEQEKQQTIEIQRQLELEQRKMRVKASEMIRQYPSIDRSRINSILAESNAMTLQGKSAKELSHRYKDLNMQMKEVEAQTKRVTANTNTMVGAFQNAIIKFPIKFIICVGIKLL